MNNSWFQSGNALASRLLRTLGPQGLVGLALILIALIVALAMLRPLRSEIDGLKRQIREKPAVNVPAFVAAPESSAGDQLLQSLPDVQGLGPLLVGFAREAQRNHLAFTAAEYLWTPSTVTHLGEYEVKFDATGSYLEIRQFCAGVLNTQPAMALRQLTLMRENTGDAVLKARMRWVIFVQDEEQ